MGKRFCPKCKSEEVEIKINPLIKLGSPQGWLCNNCGYSNVIFPEKVKLNKVKLKH